MFTVVKDDNKVPKVSEKGERVVLIMKTKKVTMTMSYSEFPARPGSQVARLDFDIGAGLVGGQRF